MELPSDISSCHVLILQQHHQNDQQQLQIDQQAVQIEMLLAKISELEDRLNKNSQNSNKPPSSDGLKKKPKQKSAFGRKKGKKSGGQPGHKGKTLEMVSSPDHIKPLLPSHCGCGGALDKLKAKVVESRQVFDLPEPKLEITEYLKLGCSCDQCGRYNEGEFPGDVIAHVQYGFGVKALVVLLNVSFKVPIKKIRCLFGDLYGYAINDNTIIKASKKCYEQLAPSEKIIKRNLLESLVVHFDETGMRVAGKLHWLHTACTKTLTYLFIHAKRGKQALADSDSILVDFTNWAIHDCWSSYFNFDKCLHAICGAHILRELQALEEKETQWATWFKRYLLTLYHLSEKGIKSLTAAQQHKALSLFETIWAYADQAEPPPQKPKGKRGRPKASKGRNLLTRLKKHQAALLAFSYIEEVPFTNNQAERDLRPAKTKQKVSGCFRTLKGAQIYARIHGFISTIRKQQLSVFKELKGTFEGNTFLTQPEAP